MEDETSDYTDMMLLEAAIFVRHHEAVEFLLRRFAHGGLHMIGKYGIFTCPSRHLGTAAAFLGRPDETRTYYEEAMDIWPPA